MTLTEAAQPVTLQPREVKVKLETILCDCSHLFSGVSAWPWLHCRMSNITLAALDLLFEKLSPWTAQEDHLHLQTSKSRRSPADVYPAPSAFHAISSTHLEVRVNHHSAGADDIALLQADMYLFSIVSDTISPIRPCHNWTLFWNDGASTRFTNLLVMVMAIKDGCLKTFPFPVFRTVLSLINNK